MTVSGTNELIITKYMGGITEIYIVYTISILQQRIQTMIHTYVLEFVT